jgi:hypothetical protein
MNQITLKPPGATPKPPLPVVLVRFCPLVIFLREYSF